MLTVLSLIQPGKGQLSNLSSLPRTVSLRSSDQPVLGQGPPVEAVGWLESIKAFVVGESEVGSKEMALPLLRKLRLMMNM